MTLEDKTGSPRLPAPQRAQEPWNASSVCRGGNAMNALSALEETLHAVPNQKRSILAEERIVQSV